MVYTPQRRHAVASISSAIQALAVMEQFYTPNILVSLSRSLIQAQVSVAPYVHPTRSLVTFFFMLSTINAAAMFLHLLDFWSGMNGGKGIVLDFVGQTHPASLTRIILMDLSIYSLQITSLTVSYITNHSSNIPRSSAFPYDDLLLPSTDDLLPEEASDTAESDMESGLRWRKGKGKVSAEDEENALWLDDEDTLRGTRSSSTSALLGGDNVRSRRREPPLIFSLSLPHLLNLIFRLPAPSPGSRMTAGGTPSASPSPTPTSEVPSSALPTRSPRSPRTATSPRSPRRQGGDDDSETESEDDDVDEGGTRGTGSRRSRRGAAGSMPDVGRIPGDYWVGIPTSDR